MRLFVAVELPQPVLETLVALGAQLRTGAPERVVGALRWAEPAQLHVTLRFLGDVSEDQLAEVCERLSAAALAPAEAVLGPAVVRLGRQVLCVPVEGLDELAAGVVAATADVGAPPEPRPFRGHVTLARVRGRRGGAVDRGLTGALVSARWPVTAVGLVRSHLGSGGSRYEVVRDFPTGRA